MEPGGVIYLHHEAHVSLGRWTPDSPPRWQPGVSEGEFEALFEATASRLECHVETNTASFEHFELAPDHRRLAGTIWLHSRVSSPPIALLAAPDAPQAVACVCLPDTVVARPPEAQCRALALAERAHDPFANAATRAGTPYAVRHHTRRVLVPVAAHRHDTWSWRLEFVVVREHYRDADRVVYEITLRCRCPPSTTSAQVVERCEPHFRALSTALGTHELEREQTLLAHYLRDAAAV